jgi:beta-N-acetylglucosaminidase
MDDADVVSVVGEYIMAIRADFIPLKMTDVTDKTDKTDKIDKTDDTPDEINITDEITGDLIDDAEKMDSLTEDAVAVSAVGEYYSYNAMAIRPDFGFPREYITFRNRNSIKTQDMRQKSQICEEVLSEYLGRFPNLLGIASTLIEVQEEYAVNAILLLAIIRHESGNGRSNLAVSQNNLGGIIAPAQSVAVFRSFDSKEECVRFMARLLAQQYLTEGGRFFNGYTLDHIARRYASSRTWSTLIRNLMFEIQLGLDKIADQT